MNEYYEKAIKMSDEIINNRRTFHTFAETGFELHKTVSYVQDKLKEYGLKPELVGRSGITCTVGRPGKTILLRADMDALPMKEETNLDFAAENGNCHSCGHDCHTAMLL
ncbi:MAG: M20/M25/M40 family metallo-hydrolase, partial [Sedimentibacter sp.]